MITQVPRGSCQLSLQRTGGDLIGGRPRITWLSTIQQDLRSHNLTLPEAMDMDGPEPVSVEDVVDVQRYSATQSHARNDDAWCLRNHT